MEAYIEVGNLNPIVITLIPISFNLWRLNY